MGLGSRVPDIRRAFIYENSGGRRSSHIDLAGGGPATWSPPQKNPDCKVLHCICLLAGTYNLISRS